MAYNENDVSRVRRLLAERGIEAEEKRMFGGLCFMVDGKMCCGLHYDKKKNSDLFMGRIGRDALPAALERPGCFPMDFTGRPMKDYVFVAPDGYETEDDLRYWIDLCLRFNPEAKASRK